LDFGQHTFGSTTKWLSFLKAESASLLKKLRKLQKSSSHHLRKRGHLGSKAPSPEKKKVTEQLCSSKASLH